jgi:hypothetical protein
VADFLSTLQRFESGGRNIPNTTQGTSSGQAQGYNQITTGTWKEFGGLAYAPTPLQATPEQQNAIAAKIPLKRWAPETLAYLRNNGFSVDPNATLAANIAANHGALGTPPPPHSTTPGLNTTTPSGGPTPPAAGGGDASTLPGFGTAAASKSFTEGLEKLAPGIAGGGAGGQGGQDQQPQPSPIIPPPPARNVAPPLAPAMEAQLTGYMPKPYGQTLNSFATPLEWGSAPPGASPYAPGVAAGANPLQVQPPPNQQGAGTQMAAMSPIGTSLTSLDPELYQQRMAMLYGTSSGGAYGGGY